MGKVQRLTTIRRKRIEAGVSTKEMLAVLSQKTITIIENDSAPVQYRTALSYCKALGYSQAEAEDIIINKRLIRISEELPSTA